MHTRDIDAELHKQWFDHNDCCEKCKKSEACQLSKKVARQWWSDDKKITFYAPYGGDSLRVNCRPGAA